MWISWGKDLRTGLWLFFVTVGLFPSGRGGINCSIAILFQLPCLIQQHHRVFRAHG